MVISKTNPQGIDALIAKIQTALATKLSWGSGITIYPRCYRSVINIEERNVRLIEHVERGEYKHLSNAEGNKCFFVQSSDLVPVNMTYYSTELELYFTLNLPEIKPDVIHRADEEVQSDVLGVLRKFSDLNIQRLVTGIENVYRGLDYNANDDTHPNHCFKVVLDVLRFDINSKCIN